MKNFLVLLFLCSSVFISAQKEKTIIDSLQGEWAFYELQIANSPYATPDTPYESETRTIGQLKHWSIQGNKIYEINYPCCLVKEYTYKFVEEILIVTPEGNKDDFDNRIVMYTLSLNAGSLTLFETITFGDVLYFQKQNLPKDEVDNLIKGNINQKCFYGNWEIPTGEVSVPFDAIIVSYPWKMPDSLFIDSTNAQQYFKKNKFYLEVDGVKRPFHIQHLSQKEEDFHIIPGNWVNRYIRKYDLEPYMVASVWLRRIEKEPDWEYE